MRGVFAQEAGAQAESCSPPSSEWENGAWSRLGAWEEGTSQPLRNAVAGVPKSTHKPSPVLGQSLNSRCTRRVQEAEGGC